MTKHVTRVVLLRCRGRDANSWMKDGNGQVPVSLCQLPRNEHSDSWELISSVQVRTIDGSNAEANKLHLTVDCNAVGWVLLFPTLLRL